MESLRFGEPVELRLPCVRDLRKEVESAQWAAWEGSLAPAMGGYPSEGGKESASYLAS